VGLTLLLLVSGIFTIPLVSQLDQLSQNLAYAIGRMPIILGAALAFYGRDKK
jgi:hypothetical protein